MSRSIAAGGLMLFLAVLGRADDPPKLEAAPKGFDARRDGIERGNVETLEYDSKTVGEMRKLVVYTPPGYSKETQYPVFYLLHGKGGRETSWTKQGFANVILDNLYADKKLVPMIVVMPNGEVQLKGAGGLGAGFENELLKDVMPFVESKYPLKSGAEHRAIAGLSMGGAQSFTIGFKHPDKFAWIGGFSAPGRGRATAALLGDPDAARKQLKLVWVSCGDTDSLLDFSKTLHEALDEKKIPHIWHIDSGGHEFRVWKNDLYLFAPMLFREK